MKAFRPVAILAVGAALVAVPASASAAPKVKDVRASVKQADASLSQVSQAARAGNRGQVKSAMVRLGNHVRKADRLARKIQRVADSSGERVHAAHALVSVAGQYDQLVGKFTALLDDVTANVQPLIAQALALSGDAQTRIVTMLTKLAEQLPEPVAQTVLDAIEQFQTDGDIEALIAALSSDEVIDSVKGILSEHLDGMFADLQGLVDRLGEIDPELAGIVGGILDSLHGLIDQVNDLVSHLFDGLLGGGIPLFPGFDDLPGIGDLFGDLPGFGGGGDDGGSSLLGGWGDFLPFGRH